VELRLVRSLLDGDTVDGDGEFFSFTGGVIRPRPDPAVPFLVGGRSDAAVRRAGRLGDGWLAAWCSPARFATATAMAEEVGADRDVTWRHGLQVWVGLDASREAARGHVAAAMESFYKVGFERFDRYTPHGSAADVAEFLSPYVAGGAAVLNLTPCGPDRDTEVELLAEVKRLLGA
jgi:alkanesulfonate monooxygenase SsuD/methylene tetrahydromethanopterin reductase-like flavin-dependent oxidoreductase (luciferase family)